MSFLKKISADKRGATAIEYAIIASLVALVAGVGLGALGTGLSAKFDTISKGF
jgi:pilus assembly protein Flp/PilA